MDPKIEKRVREKIVKIKERHSPSNVKIAMRISDEGILAKRAGRFDDAILYYQEIIRMFPTSGGIYYNLGKLFYLIGDFVRSQKAYTLAYINGANVFDKDLFIHLGHAIKDGEKNNHITHEYRKSIMGKNGERSEKYDNECLLCAKSRINSLAKAYEEELIKA